MPELASSSSPDDEADGGLLSTPTSRMWKGAGPAGGATQIRNKARGLIEAQVMDLLPTPSANVGTNGGSQHPEKRRAGNHQPSIQDVAEHVLLPTPRATDGPKGGPNQRGSSGDMMLPSAVMHLPTPRATRGGSGTETMYLLGAERTDEDRPQGEVVMRAATDWGPYEPAIRRWERVLGRPAPSPTEPNKNGNPRLSPAFTEWMMGAPEGWITGIPISRNEQLKACGNGVVPQQAAAALADMLAAFGEAP